jgi:electron transfer flavoprotein beta subunit
MNIIACVKQVPYPDTPASAYGVDNETKRITLPEDVPLVISPFDENAVEAGLQLKDQVGGKLTVISLATRPPEVVIRDLRQMLGMGADEAILLDDPAFNGGDSWSTAYTLAMAIEKIGEYDLILCGIQAADWDGGQVALGISEILDLPAATSVTKIEPGDGCIRARRILENGHELLELPIPCVVAIAGDEALMPRIAPLPRIIKARKRKIPVWSASDIDAEMSMVGATGAKTWVKELLLPEIEGACEFMSAEDFGLAAGMLVERLKSEDII